MLTREVAMAVYYVARACAVDVGVHDGRRIIVPAPAQSYIITSANTHSIGRLLSSGSLVEMSVVRPGKRVVWEDPTPIAAVVVAEAPPVVVEDPQPLPPPGASNDEIVQALSED
jgi:hypothetical protein